MRRQLEIESVRIELLTNALGNDTVSAMRDMVGSSEALARILERSEEHCEKSG